MSNNGERTELMTGGDGRMDLLPWRAILELARHCEDGGHNADRDVCALFDSGVRHAAQWWLGQEDAAHLAAACMDLLQALEKTLETPEAGDRQRAEAPAAAPAAEKPEAAKAPAKKAPEKTAAGTPGNFSGYGARLKREVYQHLLTLRENGITIPELAKMSGLSQKMIMQMLNAEKVNFNKWEALGKAMAAAEEAGKGNEA